MIVSYIDCDVDDDNDVCMCVSVWCLCVCFCVAVFCRGSWSRERDCRYLDKVKTTTKLGYNFTVPSFRTKVDGYIIRNLDYGKGLSFFLS